MLNTIFATKTEMTQAWSKQGKRLAITKCKVEDNCIVGVREIDVRDRRHLKFKSRPSLILEIGYGNKKIKNMSKPLREKIKKSGFLNGFKQIKGVRVYLDDEATQDTKAFKSKKATIKVDQVLKVGDVVHVRGSSKGRGFAGVVKRYGFAGGPKTHGQSDRLRAPGSIGSGTDPGRVWKNKKMPGHYGDEMKTVKGLVVVHVDSENDEVWLSGPIPGSKFSVVRITKTGQSKDISLNKEASGIIEKKTDNTESQKDKTEQKSKEQKEKKTDKSDSSQAKKETKTEQKQDNKNKTNNKQEKKK